MLVMSPPSRSDPMAMSMAPAIQVQMMRFSGPYLWLTPTRMGMNAAVGPPIATRLPPSAETKKPAARLV